MIEILILSMLGLAGTALGGVIAGGDDEMDDTSHETDNAAFEGENDSAGNSLLLGGSESEVQTGTDGKDDLAGGDGDDALYGGGGDDNLTDWSGDNQIYGGAGDDHIQGGFDPDSTTEAYGDVGDDTITDGDSDATLFGGAGNDQIISGHGTGEIFGGLGDDVIETGIGTDTIFGGEGDDTITTVGTGENGASDQVFGGAGDDELHAYGTADLYGGEGMDWFSTYANTWVEDAPVIQDFNPSEDTLEIKIDGHDGKQGLDDFDVTVEDFTDGTGASVFVDGYEVMRVPGAQGLSLSDVQLTLV